MDTMEEIGEISRKEHSREEIDIISIWKLIELAVAMWMAKMVMGIISMGGTG